MAISFNFLILLVFFVRWILTSKNTTECYCKWITNMVAIWWNQFLFLKTLTSSWNLSRFVDPTPLHSTSLHSTPLHSTPLHSTPLQSTPLHSTPLHSTPLHSTPLYSTLLHSTPLHSTPLHSTLLHSTPFHPNATPIHFTSLHSTHVTSLHCGILFLTFLTSSDEVLHILLHFASLYNSAPSHSPNPTH